MMLDLVGDLAVTQILLQLLLTFHKEPPLRNQTGLLPTTYSLSCVHVGAFLPVAISVQGCLIASQHSQKIDTDVQSRYSIFEYRGILSTRRQSSTAGGFDGQRAY